MKKRANCSLSAHLLWSAFILLLFLAACAIPFALAQSRSGEAGDRSVGHSIEQSQLPTKSSDRVDVPALQTPPVPKVPDDVLYDQFNNPGTSASNSQDPMDVPQFQDFVADDFVIPPDQNWVITAVDAGGIYFNGPGPADNFNVFIYRDSGGLPAAQVYSLTAQPYANNNGVFEVTLTGAPPGTPSPTPTATPTGTPSPSPSPPILPPGTYWVTMQANMSIGTAGQWGWVDRILQTNFPAAWQNPRGGYHVCPAWAARTACIGDGAAPDQVFRLIGRIAIPRSTPTATPTVTPTATATATASPTPTATASPNPTATGTPNPTATGSPNPTVTATASPSATTTGTPGATATPTASATPTSTSVPCHPTPGCISYQAESSDNTLTGSAIVLDCPTCSGGQKVGYVGNNDGTLQFNLVGGIATGNYTMTVRYLNGDQADRYAYLSVNGGPGRSVTFPSTGSFQTVGSIQITVTLNTGCNTLKFYGPIRGSWGPDFDRIQFGCPAHPSFFTDEVALQNGVYYLQFPNGTPFGYYNYLNAQRWIYHQDMGYEYWFDAADGRNGIFFYDFASGHFFYTSPSFPFPYLYDLTLHTTLYYFPDPQRPGHYTTNPRYFYNFATGQIITM